MLHYAVVFFVIALIASVLGFRGIAGMSAQIGWARQSNGSSPTRQTGRTPSNAFVGSSVSTRTPCVTVWAWRKSNNQYSCHARCTLPDRNLGAVEKEEAPCCITQSSFSSSP